MRREERNANQPDPMPGVKTPLFWFLFLVMSYLAFSSLIPSSDEEETYDFFNAFMHLLPMLVALAWTDKIDLQTNVTLGGLMRIGGEKLSKYAFFQSVPTLQPVPAMLAAAGFIWQARALFPIVRDSLKASEALAEQEKQNQRRQAHR